MAKASLKRNVFSQHLIVVRVSQSQMLNGIEFQLVTAEYLMAQDATFWGRVVTKQVMRGREKRLSRLVILQWEYIPWEQLIVHHDWHCKLHRTLPHQSSLSPVYLDPYQVHDKYSYFYDNWTITNSQQLLLLKQTGPPAGSPNQHTTFTPVHHLPTVNNYYY